VDTAIFLSDDEAEHDADHDETDQDEGLPKKVLWDTKKQANRAYRRIRYNVEVKWEHLHDSNLSGGSAVTLAFAVRFFKADGGERPFLGFRAGHAASPLTTPYATA
jgi:hypothetical protein